MFGRIIKSLMLTKLRALKEHGTYWLWCFKNPYVFGMACHAYMLILLKGKRRFEVNLMSLGFYDI